MSASTSDRGELRPLAAGLVATLQVQGTLEAEVQGDCMWPSLRNGDTVRIVSSQCPLCGDVIVFLSDGKVYAHRVFFRITLRGTTRYLAKCDNIARFDRWVTDEQVVGVVTECRRDGVITSSVRRPTDRALRILYSACIAPMLAAMRRAFRLLSRA